MLGYCPCFCLNFLGGGALKFPISWLHLCVFSKNIFVYLLCYINLIGILTVTFMHSLLRRKGSGERLRHFYLKLLRNFVTLLILFQFLHKSTHSINITLPALRPPPLPLLDGGVVPGQQYLLFNLTFYKTNIDTTCLRLSSGVICCICPFFLNHLKYWMSPVSALNNTNHTSFASLFLGQLINTAAGISVFGECITDLQMAAYFLNDRVKSSLSFACS